MAVIYKSTEKKIGLLDEIFQFYCNFLEVQNQKIISTFAPHVEFFRSRNQPNNFTFDPRNLQNRNLITKPQSACHKKNNEISLTGTNCDTKQDNFTTF